MGNAIPVHEWDYEKKLSEAKYILAGLRLYGDMLAETVTDPAMQTFENKEGLEGFIRDQYQVERLILEYEDTIATYEQELR